jgi:hypothetical protein
LETATIKASVQLAVEQLTSEIVVLAKAAALEVVGEHEVGLRLVEKHLSALRSTPEEGSPDDEAS